MRDFERNDRMEKSLVVPSFWFFIPLQFFTSDQRGNFSNFFFYKQSACLIYAIVLENKAKAVMHSHVHI